MVKLVIWTQVSYSLNRKVIESGSLPFDMEHSKWWSTNAGPADSELLLQSSAESSLSVQTQDTAEKGSGWRSLTGESKGNHGLEISVKWLRENAKGILNISHNLNLSSGGSSFQRKEQGVRVPITSVIHGVQNVSQWLMCLNIQSPVSGHIWGDWVNLGTVEYRQQKNVETAFKAVVFFYLWLWQSVCDAPWWEEHCHLLPCSCLMPTPTPRLYNFYGDLKENPPQREWH